MRRLFDKIRFILVSVALLLFLKLDLLGLGMRLDVFKENKLRYEQSVTFLQGLNKSNSVFISGTYKTRSPGALNAFDNFDDSQDTTGITIVSVQRNKELKRNYYPGYLPQVVAELLRLLNNSNTRMQYRLFVCNVDLDPENYPDIRLIPHWIPTFTRFSDISSIANESIKGMSIFEKAKQDYVYCLNQTLHQNVDSVLMLEDDALPLPDLFPALHHVKDRLFNPNYRRHYSKRDILFLKLYHPERLLEYDGFGVERIPELVSLSLLLTTLQIIAYNKFSFTKRARPTFSTWIWCVLCNSILLFIIGRMHIIEIRRITTHLYQITYTPSCCTQALFYPKEGAITLIKYLNSVKCNDELPIDTAIDILRTKTNLVSRMVLPNLFQHIGHYSSVKSDF